MKRLGHLPERDFLQYFFLFFSCSFLIGAFCMPDRANMLRGYYEILHSPALGGTNYFDVGGYAATFLNMGLVGLICTALYWFPGHEPHHASTLVTLLTTGFGAWGIHPLNMFPTTTGVMLYCLVRKKRLGDYTNCMLFTSGLAPFISELMIRYPNADPTGVVGGMLALAFAVGLVVGFFMPAGLDNAPKIHKGFALYSAALPVGMMAFLLQGILYKAMGLQIPANTSDPNVASATIVNTFCIIFFSVCIIGALCMKVHLKTYWSMITHHSHVIDFAAHYGNAIFLLNVGLYGFFILGYFNWIGVTFNGVLFGSIFCMLSTCNSGSHPLNTMPIIWGYALGSKLFQFFAPITGGDFTQYLHTQSIAVGICYANGLSPLVSQYGWGYGMVAAFLHFCMVTTVPQLHGGMCLYNGGFTAAMVCLLMIPMLEHHFKTKHERKEHRLAKKNAK